jgi:Ca2+-dependent lipid-binding protein
MSGYILRVFLHGCSDLLAADYEMIDGKRDPYVTLSIGSKKYKSSCIKETLNPHWTPPERFEYIIPRWENEFLTVNVFDYDHFSRDDLIGSAVIPLALYRTEKFKDLYTYPLVLPKGTDPKLRSNIQLEITLCRQDGRPMPTTPKKSNAISEATRSGWC